MPGDPGPAVSRPPPGWQTVPDPPQSLFSPRHLCFHIFLTVLLCLWFLIELPRSDTSSGCYIILSNSAPSAGHYLTATTPGLPGGQQSMTSLASIRWVGGLGGPGAPGGKTCDGRVWGWHVPGPDMLWHGDSLLTLLRSFVSCHNSFIKRFANR